ncbi:MAG: hypothetical protein KJ072_15750 [Verrucomicrobia bacterium]|nr:hypothetical protein [Verrucomicrobiota bacterium]
MSSSLKFSKMLSQTATFAWVVFGIGWACAQDGVFDASFDVGLGPDGTIEALAVQRDGKILVGGSFSNFAGFPRLCLARLNDTGAVDFGFACEPGPNGTIYKLHPSSDGKVIVLGEFTEIGGEPRLGIARLNADGSADPTFDGSEQPVNSYGLSWPLLIKTVIQPDGKLLLAGFFQSVRGLSVSGVARLNADGSVDTSFQPFPGTTYSQASDLVLQPDGKMIIVGEFARSPDDPERNLLRLNPDGSEDYTFSAPEGLSGGRLALQENGDLILTSSSTIRRLSVDGIWNSDEDLVVYPYFYDLFSGPGDRMYLFGTSEYGGMPTGDLVRINRDGTRDWSFDTGIFRGIDALAFQPDGKLLVASTFTTAEGNSRTSIARLFESSPGSIVHFEQLSYSTSETNTSLSFRVIRGGATNLPASTGYRTVEESALAGVDFVARTGRVEFAFGERFRTVEVPVIDDLVGAESHRNFGVVLENPGKGVSLVAPSATVGVIQDNDHLDLSFSPGAIGEIRSMLLLPQDRLLVSGQFTNIGGIARYRIARLDSSGAVDMEFDPENRLRILANGMALGPDSSILVAGGFTNVAGLSRQSIARLSWNGSVAEDFVPPEWLGFVSRLGLQPDGKVVILTKTSRVEKRGSLVRLNADGSHDTSFLPELGALSNTVSAFAIQPDGRLLATVGARSPTNLTLLRLQADGSIDQSYAGAVFPPWSTAESITLQNDGRVIVALGSDWVPRQLRRFNTDGTEDPSWHGPDFWSFPWVGIVGTSTFSIDVVLTLPDRRVVVAGALQVRAGTDHFGVVRLNPDGSVDDRFNPGRFEGLASLPSWPIFGGGAVQEDGNLILGGLFRLDVETARTNLVRIPPGPPLVSAASFENVVVEPNQAPRIRLRFEGTQFFVVEASIDFAEWQPIYTNSSSRLIHTIVDSADPQPRYRFYRAVPWR